MTAPKRHRWGDPSRTEHKTERVCKDCGLIKVSHHEGDAHWIDFWRQTLIGVPEIVSTDKTPACEAT